MNLSGIQLVSLLLATLTLAKTFQVSLRRQEIADRLSAWTIFNDKKKEFCDWLTQMENKASHRGYLSMEEMVEKLKKVRQQDIQLSESLFFSLFMSLVSSPKHAHVVKDNARLQHLRIIVSGCWLGWRNYSRLTRSAYFAPFFVGHSCRRTAWRKSTCSARTRAT